jgi:predicted transcriptional regulator
MGYFDESTAWKQQLPPAEKFVLLYLAKCRHDHKRCPPDCKIPEGLCNPSIDDIAEKTGLSEKTVRRAIKALAEFHTIQVWRVGLAGGPRGKNYYTLAWAGKSFIPKRAQLVKYVYAPKSPVTMTAVSPVIAESSQVTMTAVQGSQGPGNLESSILILNPEEIGNAPPAKNSQEEAEKILPEEEQKESISEVTVTAEKFEMPPIKDWEEPAYA